MLKTLYNHWAAEHARNTELIKEMTMANVQRFFLIGIIGAIVALAHLLNFGLMQPQNDVEARWRLGIILSHSFILFWMIGLILIGLWYRRKKPAFHPTFKILQTAFLIMILTIGIIISVIDQQVTTNISPFIMGSLIGGLTLYSRPSKAVLVYSLAWMAFAISMDRVIVDPEIVLTNQVNGFTAASLGLFLSLIIWYGKRRNIEQHATILAQKETLVQANAQLAFLARHDQLTGLLNRSAFIESVESHLNNDASPGCLIMADIDHFKAFNDRHGHPKGDQLLVAFAKRLKEQVGSNGTVCRWGGEEFVIHMHQTPLRQCIEQAEKLRELTMQVHLDLDEDAQDIAASFGVTALIEDESKSFDSAYERVDKALYRAKSEGRNRVAASHQSQKKS